MSGVNIHASKSGSIQGIVTPGFETVAETFATTDIGDGGASFSAFVDGEQVVNIWRGYARPGSAWKEDTVSTLFSATKGLAATSMAILVDRGLVEPDEKVSRYWPEFAQSGKEDALVRHILDHSVGLVGLPHAEEILSWDGAGWDRYDEIEARLAGGTPAWKPGEHNAYHAITYGWLVAALVRRIDGRTLGAFFREEIAQPLALDLWIGTPIDIQEERGTTLHRAKTEGLPPEAIEAMESMKKMGTDPNNLWGQANIAVGGKSVGTSAIEFFGSPIGRTPENAGAGGMGTAAALAKLYSVLSMGGALGGRRLLNESTIEQFRTYSSGGSSYVQVPGFPSNPYEAKWGLGFQLNNIKGPGASMWTFGPNDESFGHSGLGGQVGFADPVRRVGACYLRSHESHDFEASNAILESLYATVGD